MRKPKLDIIGIVFLFLASCVLSGCDIHQFPDERKGMRYLKIEFDTHMPKKYHNYDGSPASPGVEDADNVRTSGTMRYRIRIFPLLADGKPSSESMEEITFTRDVSEGYDCVIPLDLEEGKYKIMAWADFGNSDSSFFYNSEKFNEISLKRHEANTDYRDAFRGFLDFNISYPDDWSAPDTSVVEMERPFAKYEFIADDLMEFARKMAMLKGLGDAESRAIDWNDYKVVFFYHTFMPHVYNMTSDKPSDSKTGVHFETKVTQLSENEVSLGFDYVFVNGADAVVTVRVGIYSSGELISVSKPIDVPLSRSHHTIMKGAFLQGMTKSGIYIDPSYDGDYNIVIKH